MALQTSHRSEASSTPTPTSSSGTTDPNAQQTPFSPAGSPPLILAFLAIGLFSAAMIVVFGWRRFHFGRAWTLGGIATTDQSVPLPKVLPKKPVLWDLWCRGYVSWTDVVGSKKLGCNKQLQWENMAPFTANTVPLSDTAEDNITTDTPPTQSEILPPRRRFFNLRRLDRQALQLGELPQPPQRHRDSLKSIESSPSTASRSTLQVGVIIIMPSARDPTYIRTDKDRDLHEQDKHRERKGFVDYSIGIYECPWD